LSLRHFAFALAALLAGVAAARAEVAVPPLTARVTDLSGVLDVGQRTALEQKLRDFEARKGSQIAVLLLPTTQPETVEQYAIRVAETWKLGRKGVDDGALLLVATGDRKLRLEIGRGLEGPIPDSIAARIITDVIKPHLRRGDTYAGVDAGVDALIRVIDGEPLPEPERHSARGNGTHWESALAIALFIGLAGGSVLRRMFGRLVGATLTGAIVGGAVWLLTQVVIVAGLFGLIMFILTLAAGRSGSGWGGGGWSSGGGSFGGGDSGGFSGGGGDFGGGGASGSW
jgi:uncharacterized protein